MKPAEKQAVMQSFKQGDLHLLIATTVIEVGVDVPNSSLMIIENPERLGLAQLLSCAGASAAARLRPTAYCSTKRLFPKPPRCVCRCCATATTVL